MKFRIRLSDAQGVEDGIASAVDESIKDIYDKLDDDEVSVLEKMRHKNLSDVISEWIECQAAVTLEIDTVMETIKVLPNGS